MNYEFEEMSQANVMEYAKINIESWVESYTNIVDKDYLKSINTINELQNRKAALINNLKDGSLRYLLKVNNEYVGIFRVRKTKYEGYEDYGELGSLYLLNKVKKNGYGRLMYFYIHMGGVFLIKNPIRIGAQDFFENIYIFEGI